MKKLTQLTLLGCMFILPLLMTSCKKKVIEIIAVIELVKDMSISGADDIKYFDFPTEQIGFAASETSFLYKTTNGGSSWLEVPVEGGGSTKVCKGLIFFNENDGLCLMNSHLFRTSDGGDNWSLSQTSVKFLEKSESDLAVIGKCGSSSFSIDVFTSSNFGASFSLIGDIQPFNSLNACNDFQFSSCHNNQLMLHFDEEDALYGINLADASNFTVVLDDLNAFEAPRDFYINENFGVLVGELGTIQTDYSSSWYVRKYYGHTYAYNTVDGYGDLVICAGENTISTNLPINENEWNEVFSEDGNGFKTTFYKVAFSNASNFYISGANGLIQKFKI